MVSGSSCRFLLAKLCTLKPKALTTRRNKPSKLIPTCRRPQRTLIPLLSWKPSSTRLGFRVQGGLGFVNPGFCMWGCSNPKPLLLGFRFLVLLFRGQCECPCQPLMLKNDIPLQSLFTLGAMDPPLSSCDVDLSFEYCKHFWIPRTLRGKMSIGIKDPHQN